MILWFYDSDQACTSFVCRHINLLQWFFYSIIPKAAISREMAWHDLPAAPRTGALNLSWSAWHSDYTGATIFQEENLEFSQAGRMGWETEEVSTSQRTERERLLLKAYFASSPKSLLGKRGKIKRDNSPSLGGGYFERLIASAAA